MVDLFSGGPIANIPLESATFNHGLPTPRCVVIAGVVAVLCDLCASV
jgi:hypothetical protein